MLRNLYLIIIVTVTLSGCSVFEYIVGVGFDAEQFEKARESKILELQYKSAQKLEKRMTDNSRIFESDFNVILDESFLNKFLDKYENASGLLDESTDYIIKDIKAELFNGSAIASVKLSAHNSSHNVDVILIMDCLILIEQEKQDLVLKIEPFNIAPTTVTKGLYFAVKETINKIIKLNLGNLNNNLPPLKIPLNIQDKIVILGTKNDIASKINLTLNNPKRLVKYNLKIKDILFLEGKIIVGLDLDKIEVSL